MEKLAKNYGVAVTRVGLKTWLFDGSNSGVQNVKGQLLHLGVAFTSSEVFIDNSYGLEVTISPTM